ncbi:MAG: fused MFS/spermidine synthase [Flavobacteriales bacterium]|nr:fused MFS/spermidine synthase [Flavobacteriales bacterium]
MKLKEQNIKTRHTTGFLFYLKWVVSFVWPIVLERRKDQFVQLEIELNRGKLLLNTTNANYSYGNLQLAYKGLFYEEPFEWEKIKTSLILGFGAGGVCKLIYEKNPECRQTAIEISEVVVQMYHTYFKPIPNVNIIVDDAELFVLNSNEKYDLIIVDVYNDLDVPEQFHKIEFVRGLRELLNVDGFVIFNKVCSTLNQKQQFQNLILTFSQYFKKVKTNEQMTINRFIIAK